MLGIDTNVLLRFLILDDERVGKYKAFFAAVGAPGHTEK